jgi:hypothetical protein
MLRAAPEGERVTEAEWLVCESLFDLGRVIDWKNHRKVRLYGAALCRLLWDYLSDPRNRTAVEVTERYVDGDASEDDRVRACSAASGVDALSTVRTAPVHYSAASAVESLVSAEFNPNVFIVEGERGVIEADQRDGPKRAADLFRDIFDNPFRPVAFSPSWRTDTALALARQMYESRDFSAMPILADALQDAGCDNDDILNHCRGPGPHVRGCWALDLVLGKSECPDC